MFVHWASRWDLVQQLVARPSDRIHLVQVRVGLVSGMLECDVPACSCNQRSQSALPVGLAWWAERCHCALLPPSIYICIYTNIEHLGSIEFMQHNTRGTIKAPPSPEDTA